MRVKKNKKVVKKKRSIKQIAKKVQIIGHEPIRLSFEEMLGRCYPNLQEELMLRKYNQPTEYCPHCGSKMGIRNWLSDRAISNE